VSRRIERDRRLKHDINIAVLRTNGNKGLALTFHVAKEHSIYICGTLVDASYTSVLMHVLARIWMQALEAAVVMSEITDRMFHGFLPPYVGGHHAREEITFAREEKQNAREEITFAREEKQNAREEIAFAHEEKQNAREEIAFAHEEKRNAREEIAFPHEQKRNAREEITFAREQKRNAHEEVAFPDEEKGNAREEIAFPHEADAIDAVMTRQFGLPCRCAKLRSR